MRQAEFGNAPPDTTTLARKASPARYKEKWQSAGWWRKLLARKEFRWVRGPKPQMSLARGIGASLLAAVLSLADPLPRAVLQIVYDDEAAAANMQADPGLAVLVEAGQARILFDAGTDPDILLRNLLAAGSPPGSITHVVISHHHADHRGGVVRLAMENPSVRMFFLKSFPQAIYELAWAAGVHPVGVNGPVELVPDVYSTGPVGDNPPEQALVLRTTRGLVVVVGCAHPGLIPLLEAARRVSGETVIYLVAGGFHLRKASSEELAQLAAELKRIGVMRICAAHCSGERAKAVFRRTWGSAYLPAGTGRRIVVD